MAAPVIIIMGPQGSGKGTQARLLADHLGWDSFSSGALWRASSTPGLDQKLLKGALGDTEVIIKAVGTYLVGVEPEKGIVSDGFPRKINEAKWLLQTLSTLGRELKLVILLEIPRDVSLRRLIERAKIDGRKDDNIEGINNRLNLYESETKRVIDFWRSKNIVRDVNGVGTVEEVADRINEVLDEAKV